MKKNEIAIARKAIRAALKVVLIELEESGMHRIGMESINTPGMCAAVKNELALFAVNDVYHAERQKQRIAALALAWQVEDARIRKENSDAVQNMYAKNN